MQIQTEGEKNDDDTGTWPEKLMHILIIYSNFECMFVRTGNRFDSKF